MNNQNYGFGGAITISNDLSKLYYTTYKSYVGAYDYGYIVNLQNVKNYGAFTYSPYIISNNTITGKATTSAEPNETVLVQTVL